VANPNEAKDNHEQILRKNFLNLAGEIITGKESLSTATAAATSATPQAESKASTNPTISAVKGAKEQPAQISKDNKDNLRKLIASLVNVVNANGNRARYEGAVGPLGDNFAQITPVLGRLSEDAMEGLYQETVAKLRDNTVIDATIGAPKNKNVFGSYKDFAKVVGLALNNAEPDQFLNELKVIRNEGVSTATAAATSATPQAGSKTLTNRDSSVGGGAKTTSESTQRPPSPTTRITSASTAQPRSLSGGMVRGGVGNDSSRSIPRRTIDLEGKIDSDSNDG
jgi:hypothetical protein